MSDYYSTMVNRFLGWKLPPTFGPDAGVKFTPSNGMTREEAYEKGWWPVGTNLLTADEARAMLEYVADVTFIPDWSLLEATQASLREHMAMMKELRAQLAAAQSVADHLFIDARGDGPWLVCVEKVFDTEDQARTACRKWQAATGGVPEALPPGWSVLQPTEEEIAAVIREAADGVAPCATPLEDLGPLGYAARLADAIWRKHYQQGAPEWKPLPDLMGVLTQIDTMIAGLMKKPSGVAEVVMGLDEVLTAYGEASDGAFNAELLASYITRFPHFRDELNRYAQVQLSSVRATPEEIAAPAGVGVGFYPTFCTDTPTGERAKD